tara:strand:- start:190 stop:780 length:591 start_codon:yes stop_codon:yes gene_type:complete
MNLVINTCDIDSDLETEIQEFSKTTDRLSHNYGKNLDLNDSVAITTVRNGNDLIAFSTILHRKMFGNSVRILNRYFRHPEFRRMNWGHQRRIKEYTYQMILQQVLYAKDQNYDVAFISRELKDNNIDNFNSTALNRFKTYFPNNDEWIFSPKMHLVSTPKIFKQNWQSILYYKLKKEGKPPQPSISVQAYKERFIG